MTGPVCLYQRWPLDLLKGQDFLVCLATVRFEPAPAVCRFSALSSRPQGSPTRRHAHTQTHTQTHTHRHTHTQHGNRVKTKKCTRARCAWKGSLNLPGAWAIHPHSALRQLQLGRQPKTETCWALEPVTELLLGGLKGVTRSRAISKSVTISLPSVRCVCVVFTSEVPGAEFEHSCCNRSTKHRLASSRHPTTLRCNSPAAAQHSLIQAIQDVIHDCCVIEDTVPLQHVGNL